MTCGGKISQVTEKRQEGEETGRIRDLEWESRTKNKRHKRGR